MLEQGPKCQFTQQESKRANKYMKSPRNANQNKAITSTVRAGQMRVPAGGKRWQGRGEIGLVPHRWEGRHSVLESSLLPPRRIPLLGA